MSVVFNCGNCRRPVKRAKVGAGLCRRCANIENGQKRSYERRGRDLTCATCGTEFYASQSDIERGRRFCSQACMGEAQRKVGTCVVCSQPTASTQRKTCSPECGRELRSRNKRGTNNPQYRTGETAARERWKASRLPRCARCGKPSAHVHHVVYEQHVRRAGGDLHDVRNGMSLCFGCHMAHHHGGDRLPQALISDANREFAAALYGPDRASDYFARYYADAAFVADPF